MHDVDLPVEYQNFFRWTIVRNPFSRAVSLWWSTCRCHPQDTYGSRKGSGSSDDFSRFALWLSRIPPEARQREPLFMSQSEWLSPLEPIVAIHMEDLEEDLPKFSFWKEGITIPELNTTSQKIEDHQENEGEQIIRLPWREYYYEDQAVEAIWTWAGKDFERFEYSMEVEDG